MARGPRRNTRPQLQMYPSNFKNYTFKSLTNPLSVTEYYKIIFSWKTGGSLELPNTLFVTF